MARLTTALSEDQIRKTGVAQVRVEYNKLAKNYNRIVNGEIYLCPICNEFHGRKEFYSDKKYATGLYPICKDCLRNMACDYDKKEDIYLDNKEKMLDTLRIMDLPYIDSLYQSAVQQREDESKYVKTDTVWGNYVAMLKSLANWRDKRWKDSAFGEDMNEVEGEFLDSQEKKPRKEIYKIFGSGFSNEDYLYLQDQYDDWRARTQVDSKSQETYIIRICFKLLDIWKAQRSGKDTKDLDRSLNDLMAAANLQPKQNVANAATDALTFGQLIEKWENEKPIPEPAPEFKDVDGIGKYIRVWFAGHLARALGLDNGYAREYDEYVQKYKVSRPEAQEEGHSNDIYNKLFGVEGDIK